MCRCKSYNKPEWGGDILEVVLPKPDWSVRQQGICVDSCIADAILMLWSNNIITSGCCCGHNQGPPSVIIEGEIDDAFKAAELLRDNDGRKWVVQQWRLVTI